MLRSTEHPNTGLTRMEVSIEASRRVRNLLTSVQTKVITSELDTFDRSRRMFALLTDWRNLNGLRWTWALMWRWVSSPMREDLERIGELLQLGQWRKQWIKWNKKIEVLSSKWINSVLRKPQLKLLNTTHRSQWAIRSKWGSLVMGRVGRRCRELSRLLRRMWSLIEGSSWIPSLMITSSSLQRRRSRQRRRVSKRRRSWKHRLRRQKEGSCRSWRLLGLKWWTGGELEAVDKLANAHLKTRSSAVACEHELGSSTSKRWTLRRCRSRLTRKTLNDWRRRLSNLLIRIKMRGWTSSKSIRSRRIWIEPSQVTSTLGRTTKVNETSKSFSRWWHLSTKESWGMFKGWTSW